MAKKKILNKRKITISSAYKRGYKNGRSAGIIYQKIKQLGLLKKSKKKK